MQKVSQFCLRQLPNMGVDWAVLPPARDTIKQHRDQQQLYAGSLYIFHVEIFLLLVINFIQLTTYIQQTNEHCSQLYIYTKSGCIWNFYQHSAFHFWFVFSSELVIINLGQLARYTVHLSWWSFESDFFFRLYTLNSEIETSNSRLQTPDSNLYQ